MNTNYQNSLDRYFWHGHLTRRVWIDPDGTIVKPEPINIKRKWQDRMGQWTLGYLFRDICHYHCFVRDFIKTWKLPNSPRSRLLAIGHLAVHAVILSDGRVALSPNTDNLDLKEYWEGDWDNGWRIFNTNLRLTFKDPYEYFEERESRR